MDVLEREYRRIPHFLEETRSRITALARAYGEEESNPSQAQHKLYAKLLSLGGTLRTAKSEKRPKYNLITKNPHDNAPHVGWVHSQLESTGHADAQWVGDVLSTVVECFSHLQDLRAHEEAHDEEQMHAQNSAIVADLVSCTERWADPHYREQRLLL